MPSYALHLGPSVTCILDFADDKEAVDHALGQPTATKIERADSGRVIWERPAEPEKGGAA